MRKAYRGHYNIPNNFNLFYSVIKSWLERLAKLTKLKRLELSFTHFGPSGSYKLK